ncbi:MAG TPA: cupin domain-containing protein [Candidatus Dormibacteraeota bacterium]|nr:cupin domain-containing protein [Candidatus Dormibacteraeota bacterium]
MKRILIAIGLGTLLAAALALAGDPSQTGKTGDPQATSGITEATPTPQSEAMAQASEHRYFTPADIKWTDAPPSLPKGAKVAVLEGDLASPGPFTMRAMVPAGYKIPPHFHPGIEHVTVLSGSFFMGMGETFDESKGHELAPGSFSYMVAGARHFAWTKKATVLQIHGMGPWGITYVNATDDPRNQKQAAK